MKRNVLGKGLDVLLPEPVLETGLRQIDIDLIKPNTLQPRMYVAPESLQELADSISENGVLQPVIVRSRDSEFELVAGERRWRAAQRAGLQSIPAIIQDLSDEKMLELALVENIQRDDLTAIEEAHAYQVLVEKFHLSQDEVARRVGKSRSAVANILRLLNLSQDVQQMLLEGAVSMGHARALLPLPEKAQRRLARKVIRRGLSVRQTERAVKHFLQPKPSNVDSSTDPNLMAAQQRLEERFQTKVEIQMNGGINGGMNGGSAGRLILHFHNSEELQRLYESLVA